MASTKVVTTASTLEFMRVETVDGDFLGHVFDIRCRWEKDANELPILEAIVYGRRGLLERVGLRGVRPRTMPWNLVEAIHGDVIIVRAVER
jgi:sporulation protein YlmC with PRC-barrel domain